MPRTAQFVKNLERFRLVTFDVTDTLLRFRKAPAVQYAKTAAELGIVDINQDILSKCFKQKFKMMANKYPNFGYNTPGMTWEEWWAQLVETIFLCVQPTLSKSQLRPLADTLIRLYRTRECWAPIDGSKELIQQVRNTGKYVGVISNFDPSLPQVLKEMGLEHDFDFILTSYETGIQKPNTKIFEIPLNRCKVKPHEALHIGNLYEIDYLGARNSGWCSLLIAKNIEEHVAIDPAHVYPTLSSMLHALETKDVKW